MNLKRIKELALELAFLVDITDDELDSIDSEQWNEIQAEITCLLLELDDLHVDVLEDKFKQQEVNYQWKPSLID